MVTAGRFAEFPSCYFTHFFIDEAGHATEPECLIALAGIALLLNAFIPISNSMNYKYVPLCIS
jgi:hypothetical protein